MDDKARIMEREAAGDELKFVLERDEYGYAAGISVGGFWVIHLHVGTVRNEEFADWIVGRLNGGMDVSLVADLLAENERLRDSLRWYRCVASDMGSNIDHVSANDAMLEMQYDAGRRARVALGEE